MAGDAATRWALDLQEWGIPAQILDRAPASPWIHPTESFRPSGNLFVDTPSRRRALETLIDLAGAPSVLDVGCGGGRASFGLVPPARLLVGIDQQPSMLEVFSEEALSRGIEALTILGSWPDVAPMSPRCDVVVCHHVLFNVADLVPFVNDLASHAARRVVIELPTRHPLANLSAAWKFFWDLDRPTSPTAEDAWSVVLDMGFHAQYETFTVPDHKTGVSDRDVEHTRVRLCLPASRDAEVREFLRSRPTAERELATIWWDT